MKTFEVRWVRCPTAYNPTNMLYIEATDEKAAETLARDHVKRALGVGDWIKIEVSEYVAPAAGLGRVLSGPPTDRPAFGAPTDRPAFGGR